MSDVSHPALQIIHEKAKGKFHFKIGLVCAGCGEVILLFGVEHYMFRSDKDFVDLGEFYEQEKERQTTR